MARHVVDIHSISSSDGWHYEEYGMAEPVLCLALVSVVETSKTYVPPERMVIALGKDDMSHIIGMEVESRHTDIKFGPIEM